jgi:hypothetical protein
VNRYGFDVSMMTVWRWRWLCATSYLGVLFKGKKKPLHKKWSSNGFRSQKMFDTWSRRKREARTYKSGDLMVVTHLNTISLINWRSLTAICSTTTKATELSVSDIERPADGLLNSSRGLRFDH